MSNNQFDPNKTLAHHFHTDKQLVRKIQDGYLEEDFENTRIAEENVRIAEALGNTEGIVWPNSAEGKNKILADGLKALDAIARGLSGEAGEAGEAPNDEPKSILNPKHPMSPTNNKKEN